MLANFNIALITHCANLCGGYALGSNLNDSVNFNDIVHVKLLPWRKRVILIAEISLVNCLR